MKIKYQQNSEERERGKIINKNWRRNCIGENEYQTKKYWKKMKKQIKQVKKLNKKSQRKKALNWIKKNIGHKKHMGKTKKKRNTDGN